MVQKKGGFRTCEMVFQYTRDTRYLSARGKLVMWAYAHKLEVRINDLEFFAGEIGQLAGSRRRKNLWLRQRLRVRCGFSLEQ